MEIESKHLHSHPLVTLIRRVFAKSAWLAVWHGRLADNVGPLGADLGAMLDCLGSTSAPCCISGAQKRTPKNANAPKSVAVEPRSVMRQLGPGSVDAGISN